MFEPASIINQDLFFKIHNISNQNSFLDGLMIFGADYLIFLCFLVTIYLAVKKNVAEKKALLLILLSFGVGFVLVKTIGALIYEPRPYVTYNLTALSSFAPNDSFPSDHITIMTILASAYSYYKSKYTVFFIVALIIIGFSRIYVGVHYPGDILGGIIFGLVAVWISTKVKKYLVNKLSN